MLQYFSEGTSANSGPLSSISNELSPVVEGMASVAPYLPYIILGLCALAFLIGFWFNYKWSIFKVVSIILTMIICVVLYNTTPEIVAKVASDSESKDTETIAKAAVPFFITILAIPIYWSIRGLFFFITLIIQLCTIKRRKKKKEARKAKGKRGNRIWTRFLFGTTNAVLTLPGTLLMSNVVTTAMNNTSAANATNVGVKIMTAGKGASVSGIALGTVAIADLFNTGSRLFTAMQNPESEWTKEQLREIVEALNKSSAVLNNTDFQNMVKDIAWNYVSKENSDTISKDSGLNDYIEKSKEKLEKENPNFNSLSKEEQNKELTKYIVDEINNVQDYKDLGLSDKAKEYLNVAKYLVSSLTPSAQENLTHISAQIFNLIPVVKESINTQDVMKALFDNLSKFKIDSNGNHKEEPQPTESNSEPKELASSTN
ncbi:hypothetical protein ACX1NB_00510 [Mycoplasma sp. HF14]